MSPVSAEGIEESASAIISVFVCRSTEEAKSCSLALRDVINALPPPLLIFSQVISRILLSESFADRIVDARDAPAAAVLALYTTTNEFSAYTETKKQKTTTPMSQF